MDTNILSPILLPVSSLITSEDLQTDQVRDEALFFVIEPRRVSVHTSALSSVPSRGNPKTAMIPLGAVHRRTRRMMGRLTGGRSVDMKDERHHCGTSATVLPHPLSGVHNPRCPVGRRG